jgi:SAM-dependent methyltransferase
MSKQSSYDQAEFISKFYDHVGPYRDRPDIAFYVELAKRSPGPVLELGCGTGRILLPTARAGVEITGLDSSAGMLRICRESLDSLPPESRGRVRLIECDMRSFDIPGPFDLITIPFRPFQHLDTVEDQLKTLACVHRHLSERGRFVFDVFFPSLKALVAENVGEEIGEEPEFILPGGERVVRKHRVLKRDPINQMNHVELVYYVTYPDGNQERLVHSFTMRHFFRFEIEHLLVRAGFELETIYGDFEGNPLGEEHSAEMICVAVKRPT